MSDIVERLLLLAAVDNCQASIEAADTITRLRADIINYKIRNKDLQDHCAEITNLTVEVEQNRTDLEEYRRDVERLRAALKQIAGIDPWGDGEQGYVDKARAALSGDKQ